MARYKPGDCVVVRDDIVASMSTRYCMYDDPTISDVANTQMVKLAGQVCTIDKITAFGKYRIHEDGRRWNWTDEMFSEPCVELDDIDINVCVGSLM